MKKAILFGAMTGIILLFIGLMPVHAEIVHNTLSGEVDMPKLVGLKQIHPDLFLGLSASKPVASNLFHSSFNGIEDDQNYFYGVKVTFFGCVINCPDK